MLCLNPNSTLGCNSRTRIACSSSVNSGHVNLERAEFGSALGSLRKVENKRKTQSMEKILNRPDVGLVFKSFYCDLSRLAKIPVKSELWS